MKLQQFVQAAGRASTHFPLVNLHQGITGSAQKDGFEKIFLHGFAHSRLHLASHGHVQRERQHNALASSALTY
jgi:hypothetical protein